MWLALGLFAVMYALLLKFAEKRWIIALSAAALFIVLGILPVGGAIRAINWNVLMMLAGTMAIVELFIQSGMPQRMAEGLLNIVPDVRWAIVALSLFSGIISAFVDNVATVLMVAPVGLAVAKQIKTNPIPVIIAITVSSNLQGAATLVGDTTSILLAGYAGMSFNDFFVFHGRLGIFFAVEVGALLTIPVLLWLFRGEKGRKITPEKPTEVELRCWQNYPRVGTLEAVISCFDQYAEFSRERNAPVFCGEFGCFMSVPEERRIKWYELVTPLLAERGIARTSWDYYGGFGVFNRGQRGVRPSFPENLNRPLLRALGLNADV